ncbi:MAG: imidazolonepropionase [Candidatus Velthaea sp.]
MKRLLTNMRLATMTGPEPYGMLENAALVIEDERIVYSGSAQAAPAADETIDLEGRCVTPGLIDPHTHLIYGGNRAQEWELRLKGVPYVEIARRGGGIASTMKKTRAASDEELLASASARLQHLLAEGVTTVEIKSGYGLDAETEIRTLRVARRLGETLPVTVRTTFLGAHSVPPEFRKNADGYIDMICRDLLPRIAAEQLADAVDGFCETVAFTSDQIARVFERCRVLGLRVKLHADQLSDGGGAALAARFSALSADHLEHTSDAGIAALRAAGTIAVVLPGAYYFLRETQAPPIEKLRAAGVPIAIATDSNPGTSPLVSLLLAMNMACTLFRLTPEEALRGATHNAARALGIAAERGTLEAGKYADIAVWDVGHPAELSYAIGANPCAIVYKNGRRVEGRLALHESIKASVS